MRYASDVDHLDVVDSDLREIWSKGDRRTTNYQQWGLQHIVTTVYYSTIKEEIVSTEYAS